MAFGVLGFPDSSVGKESAYNAGDPDSIPGLGRSPGEGIGYPLQYSWEFLVAQKVKNLPAMWETWAERIPWRRACSLLQYSFLENPMARRAWPTAVHRVTELDTTKQLISAPHDQYFNSRHEKEHGKAAFE